MIETDIEKFIRSFNKTQQEEETMNDNLNSPTAADMAEAHKVMDDFEKLSDKDFEALLAERAKPLDGTADSKLDDTFYVTDAPETEDKPTVH